MDNLWIHHDHSLEFGACHLALETLHLEDLGGLSWLVLASVRSRDFYRARRLWFETFYLNEIFGEHVRFMNILT